MRIVALYVDQKDRKMTGYYDYLLLVKKREGFLEQTDLDQPR